MLGSFQKGGIVMVGLVIFSLVVAVVAGLAQYIGARAKQPVFRGDASRFVRDVTFIDGTIVGTSEAMIWSWEILNVGRVVWDRRYLAVSRVSSPTIDRRAIQKLQIPRTQPGQAVILEVVVIAPQIPGRYRIEFKMVDDGNLLLLPNQTPLYKEFTVK